MTPIEKADELFNKYFQKCADSSFPYNMAKDCSLIAVDEILDMLIGSTATIDYWQQVKKEIQNL